VTREEIVETIFAADLHGHFVREMGIDGGAKHIVQWGQGRESLFVEQRKIFGVGVIVAHQGVEDYAVQKPQHFGSAGAGG
jgi:hypothetical protein